MKQISCKGMTVPCFKCVFKEGAALNPIASSLLAWYDQHARVLPWRGIHDPYATWVSETMLQQTRVETVLSYYPRFLAAFPTVQALAEAPIDAVLKYWEGLGYYRRAQNLHKGARQVVVDWSGAIPAQVEQLLKISGIGEYTAGAIASIAYDQAVPAVDGNVIRVVSRLKGIRENVGIPSVKRRLTAEAAALVPRERPGDFNQALMDLGSAVCTPGTPDCDACPLRVFCDAFAAGDAETLPELPRKNPPRTIEYDLLLVFSGHRVLVRQRTEAMLQGLWIFPMLEGRRALSALPAAARRRLSIPLSKADFLGDARHVFSHQIWQMRIYALTTDADDAPEGWRFVTPDELRALPLPTAVAKARAFAMERA